MEITEIFIIVGYGVVGGSLKYIDIWYDNLKRDPTLPIYASAFFAGILMGVLMVYDPLSSILLLSIIFATGICGRIDNLSFRIVAFSSLFLLLITLIIRPFEDSITITSYVVLLLILTLSGVLDELLDEIGDKRNIKVLTTRPVLKIVLIALWILNQYALLYVFCLLAFDFCYYLVSLLSRRKVS